MDERESFVRGIIKNCNERILEIGPLNRPIVTKAEFPNCFYCDIRNTKQIKALYTGNEYLETTGIQVDVETIVDIDFVLKDSYKETFRDIEKFDYIIASHVMEHVEDIISFFNDIATVLKPKGKLCIVYPDKRYCFDHFREGASFRDAYDVYHRGINETARMVLDFYNTSINENNPIIYWSADNMPSILPKNNTAKAILDYEKVLNGGKMDDVHFWPFTDTGFLRFLYDCVRAKLMPFTCIAFQPTQENSQQFMVALEYEPEILDDGYSELENLKNWISIVQEDYNNSHVIQLKLRNEDMSQKLLALNDELSLSNKQIEELESKIVLSNNKIKELNYDIAVLVEKNNSFSSQTNLQSEKVQMLDRDNALLVSQNRRSLDIIQTLSTETEALVKTIEMLSGKNDILLSKIMSLESIQNSTIWRMTKPIRVILDFLKR